MNKELVINKPVCPKCKVSKWKTVSKGVKVQCRICGETIDFVKIESVCIKPIDAKKEVTEVTEVTETKEPTVDAVESNNVNA